MDGGFQKFFLTPHGTRKPALAHELKAVQEFQEDLREAMGLVSLYNESLGTVSNQYIYDRVEGRDKGTQTNPGRRPETSAFHSNQNYSYVVGTACLVCGVYQPAGIALKWSIFGAEDVFNAVA